MFVNNFPKGINYNRVVVFFAYSGDRVIDVGSEWRTFSNDKATKDPSRVGDTQNPLLSDGDLTTMIGKVIYIHF